MRLVLSIEGSAELSDLTTALAAAEQPITGEPSPDGTYVIHIGLSGVVPLFNAVSSLVARHTSAVTVVVQGESGAEARVDRQVATNPFELLMAVNLFNPPVGLG
jgi:hypothetical protein